MSLLRTTVAINNFNIPANTFIFTEANQMWIDGECPDRYAGSLYAWNPDLKKMEYYGFIHEDTMATIGMHEDDSWPVVEGYCSLGDITYHGSVEVVPMHELPKELFAYYFKKESARCADFVERTFAGKRHFIKTGEVLKSFLNHPFMTQFKTKGIQVKSIIINAVKKHNDEVAARKAKKQAEYDRTSNSIANLCPELAKLAS